MLTKDWKASLNKTNKEFCFLVTLNIFIGITKCSFYWESHNNILNNYIISTAWGSIFINMQINITNTFCCNKSEWMDDISQNTMEPDDHNKAGPAIVFDLANLQKKMIVRNYIVS